MVRPRYILVRWIAVCSEKGLNYADSARLSFLYNYLHCLEKVSKVTKLLQFWPRPNNITLRTLDSSNLKDKHHMYPSSLFENLGPSIDENIHFFLFTYKLFWFQDNVVKWNANKLALTLTLVKVRVSWQSPEHRKTHSVVFTLNGRVCICFLFI